MLSSQIHHALNKTSIIGGSRHPEFISGSKQMLKQVQHDFPTNLAVLCHA